MQGRVTQRHQRINLRNNAVLFGKRGKADLNRINSMMVGSMEPVLPDLIQHKLVEKHGTRLVMTPLARVMAEHFIGMERLLEIIRLTKCNTEPLDIIGELECEDVHKDKRPEKKKGAGETGRAVKGAGEGGAPAVSEGTASV